MEAIAIGLVIGAAVVYAWHYSRRTKRAIAQVLNAEDPLAAEYSVNETAEWMGRTDLDAVVERKLPHYIRRELGQSVHDKESLKASDLEYLCTFPWKTHTVHYWRARISGETEDSFATVTMHNGSPNY